MESNSIFDRLARAGADAQRKFSVMFVEGNEDLTVAVLVNTDNPCEKFLFTASGDASGLCKM